MTGSTVRVLKANKGRKLQPGDRVVLHYVCALSIEELERGAHTDHVDRSEWLEGPLEVTVGAGELLPGLEAAIADANLGDTLRVTVPPELAFGRRGIPGRVPESSTLFFDIEISTSLPEGFD
jgi:FKBP-type peptidyl-prolyl cis-trans isomerase